MRASAKNEALFSVFIRLSIVCMVIFVANPILVRASEADPNFYYYSSGRKIALPLSLDKLALRFEQGVTLEQKKTIVKSEPELGAFFEREELSIFNLTILPLSESVTEEKVIETIKSLNTKSEIEFASPVFHFPDAELTFTDEFLVKFNPSVSEQDIKAFNALNNVYIVNKRESTGRYKLRVNDPKDLKTLKTANLYYEDTITEFAVPNFVRRLEEMSVTPDDAYFEQQWALNNTGQTG